MKTKHYLIIGLLGVAIAGFILSGCSKKANKTTADTDIVAAQDEANASFIMQDVKTICDGAVQNYPAERISNNFPPCATWTRYDSAWVVVPGDTAHDTIVNIFFTGSCESVDNRTRKGEITVLWDTIPYFDSGAVITITFNNYSIKLLNGANVSVSGSCVVTNNPPNKKVFYYGDVTNTFTANLTLTYLSGGPTTTGTGTATWNTTRTCTLTSQGIYGYYYIISGSASGTTSNGETYTSTTPTPLYLTAFWIDKVRKYQEDPNFEQGQVNITRSGKSNALLLNYTSGIGHKTRAANGTINGVVYNITLP